MQRGKGKRPGAYCLQEPGSIALDAGGLIRGNEAKVEIIGTIKTMKISRRPSRPADPAPTRAPGMNKPRQGSQPGGFEPGKASARRQSEARSAQLTTIPRGGEIADSRRPKRPDHATKPPGGTALVSPSEGEDTIVLDEAPASGLHEYSRGDYAPAGGRRSTTTGFLGPGRSRCREAVRKQVGMIVGTGVDIAETERLGEALERHGERFSRRIYTPQEIAYCERFKNKAERYAARFAAKEAAFKALGTGWREGIRWLDVEVTHQPSGKPELVLTGRAKEIAEQMGVARTEVSISHANQYVVAQVIFESNG